MCSFDSPSLMWREKCKKDFSAILGVCKYGLHLSPGLPLSPGNFDSPFCRLLLFRHCPHKSWDISASLVHSFPHLEPTWRPITLLDNAHHKSSIGLSDTWGLSTRGNMRSSILSSSVHSLSPSFVPCFSLFMNWFRELYVALQAGFCHIQSTYLLLFLFM